LAVLGYMLDSTGLAANHLPDFGRSSAKRDAP